jgi:hypothetical protein
MQFACSSVLRAKLFFHNESSKKLKGSIHMISVGRSDFIALKKTVTRKMEAVCCSPTLMPKYHPHSELIGKTRFKR